MATVNIIYNKATTASVIVAAVMKQHFENQGIKVILNEIYKDADLLPFKDVELVYLANVYPDLLPPSHFVSIKLDGIGKYMMYEHDVPDAILSKVFIPILKKWELAEHLTNNELAIVHEVRKQAHLAIDGRMERFTVPSIKNNGFRNYEILKNKANDLMKTFGSVKGSSLRLNVHPELFEYVIYTGILDHKFEHMELYYYCGNDKIDVVVQNQPDEELEINSYFI